MTSIIKVDTIQNSSGTSALSIDSSGRVTKSLIPYLKLDGNSATRVTNHGSGEIFTYFDTAVSQGGLTFDSNTGRITVPVDGIYIFSYKMYFWLDAVARNSMQFRINGTNKKDYAMDLAALGDGSTTDHTMLVHEIHKMNADDYAELFVNADVYAAPVATGCEVVLIG